MNIKQIKLSEAISCMESLHGTLNDYDNSCLRLLLDKAAEPEVSQPVAFKIVETSKNNGFSTTHYYETVPKTCEVGNKFFTYVITPLYLEPPDYEALKWKCEGALESIRDHQQEGLALKARVASFEKLAEDHAQSAESYAEQAKKYSDRCGDLMAERDKLQLKCEGLCSGLRAIEKKLRLGYTLPDVSLFVGELLEQAK